MSSQDPQQSSATNQPRRLSSLAESNCHFDRARMPCDWSARLDARGYHATAAGKRPDSASRWDCEPTASEEDGWPEGDRIVA